MARPKKQRPVVAEPPAIPEARHVFDRVMSCSDVDGVMSSVPVKVSIDDNGRFSAQLPPHIVAHCERTEVFSDRVVGLVQDFENLNEDYSITTLRQKATKPMLMVTLRDDVGKAAHDLTGLSTAVMMGIRVVSVNPEAAERVYLREGDKTLTMIVNTQHASPYILLPDTPEIRERLDAMVMSIYNASVLLRRLIEAEDPAAALMSMTGPWTPKADVPPPAAAGTFVSDDEI